MSGSSVSAPTIDVEDVVREIWAQVLLINADDVVESMSLFSHGVNSFQLMSIRNQMCKKLALQIPMSALIGCETFGDLVALARTFRFSAEDTRQKFERNIVPHHAREAPLSSTQAPLWFMNRSLDGLGTAYNFYSIWRFKGVLDTVLLENVFRATIARHSMLRTGFEDVLGVPKQFVRNEAPFDLSVVDFMRLSRTAARNAVHDHLTIEINKPFDLTKPPLIRATCLLLRGKETVMIVNASHLVMDATGSDILLDELQARYNAACSDIELDMPTPALEYSDYCIWEKSYMTPSGPAASEHRAFWLATLKKAPMFTTLSLDRPRPTAPVFHASQISRSLPRSVTKLLKSMTPSVVLRTALDTTLFLYTGQTDMVVGTVISGRPPGTETILASMAAALPFRTQISADTTFAEAQQRATATLAGLIDHHHMPLNEIFLCVQNDDDDEQHSLESSAHRLFQIMLLVEPDMPSMLRFGGATAVPQPIEDNSNVFDLVLSLRTIVNGDLELQATYQTALFDDNTIQLLLVHIVRVLEDMLANPDKQIGDACLLSEEELHALKTDDGALDRTLVAIAPATVESLHHLFIQQAMLRPDHLAAMQDGVSITYRELLEDAVQLAAAIQRVVAAKTIVGVLATRSFDMLTAVFGCLMAGCPYVMIDACQTPDFVQYLLRDAGCTLIVSPPELAQHVPEESAHVPIVLLGQSALNVAEFNPHTPDPDDVAYYVYTSGTSGSPKGIGMSHRNMANHVRIAADPDIFGLSYSDRIMQFFAIGFDGAAHEWFMTLCNGATLVLRSESVAQTLSQHKVSATFIMPSMLATLRPKDFPDLKVAVCGGERLAPSLSEVWGGELRLFNGYGPSETTAIALRERILPGQPITIGRPFPGYFTYCVDERLRLIPPGNPGELLIGGIGVASGYLNRPDLTAQKFISNPFGPGKLYRTGDRVRRLIDGRYEFLGRVEEGQVKVRGFRIELSGVECAIVKASLKSASLVKVENVAATARNNNLYGYVTPENVDVPTLLEELRKLVPASMVPSAIRALPSLPVTRNGKCNKSELPDLAVDAGQFVETTTDLQKQLAALWRDLLHVERVGLDDCFFRLGGHSLLVVQALARMEEMFGIRITISEAFSNSRLREIAALVEMRLGLCSKTSDAEEGPSFPLITDRPAVLPLSSAQASLWIVDYLQPALRTAYNCPLVLKMSGSLDAKALRDAFSCLIARHEVLRTSFPTSSAGTPFQQISAPTQSVSWSFSELESSVPEAETECALMTLLKKEIAKPFDLSKGPLIRVHLIDTGSHRDFVLSVLLHHIVTDAVSISNLMVEVKEIYGALTTGLKPSIRPVPQYADYALWEREWAQTAAYAQHLEFWKKSLANVPDTLQFPKDFPRSNAPPASKTAQIAISTDTCNIARALAQRASVTEFTLYFAVFQILLWRMSNQSDFVVGVPSSIRRGNRDFEQMQGYFVNTLPCRSVLSEIDAGDNNTFMDVLRLVSKSLADAREHEVPFNAILDHLKIQRSSDNSPLFQTLFILDNNRGYQQPFLLRGLTATEEVAIAPPMSKFDMSFTVSLGPSGGELWIEYNSLLFLPKRMERLGSHFCQLLGAGVTVPETQVFNLPLMSPAEMSNMIVDFNNTDQRHPIDKTVPDLIQDAVAKNPNGIALKFNGHTMSYAEVDAASNGVANQLTALGVGEGDRVGVAVNRSLQLVLLLLGILKAGAAFCPIVPSSPDDSLAGTLKDLALSVVLAEPADVRKVEKCIEMAEQTGTKVLSLKAESLGPLGGGNPKRTPLKCKADSPLYCLTTSGTTGLPKSFVFLHRNMVNLLGHFHRAYPLQQGDRVLFKTPLTFDLFAMEIFWTLTQGAAIIIAPPNAHQMVDELASLVIREKVTVATFLPAVLALFLEEIRMLNTPGAFSSLRLMLVTGEAFPADLVDAVFKVWPNIKLINGYGPGETHICTVHECVPGQSIVHIGKPIDNTYIYILDKWSQPVPIGVIGELVIGGACVGGGYINRVELTERSFVRDPLVKDKRTTCYRSSDLASYDEHGTITLFGRSDHQVKLHGVRVELVGIEAILRGLYGVKNAAVKVWNVNGVDRLTAYVVLSEHTLLDTVKMGARERLLGHSVPSLWSIMQELPLNANGKIDRKNLPSPANEKRMPETKVLTANADTQKDKNRAELLLNKPKAHVNRNLQSATLYETHKKYWMDRVEDFPDGPNLPVVNALVSGPQKLKRVRETIDTQAFAAIKTAAKQHEVSISSVIATAYSEVLSRWSNSDNFVIALKLFDFSTSVAPENRAINLCLEIDLSMGPDFLTRARSVEERLTKDMQNNLFDALAMQRALGRDREHTGRALFPCAFTCALKNNNVTTAQYEEIAGAKTQNSQIWIDFRAYVVHGELNVEWNYSEEVFPPMVVLHMHRALVEVLRTLVDPTLWDRTMDVIPASQVLTRQSVNSEAAVMLEPRLLHEAFFEQAAERPERIAIVAPGRTLTYGELAAESLYLAGSLRSSGATPNVLIAVILEKGWMQSVAVYGCLASGAAYVPIDPQHPPKRIEGLLRQGRVSHVITQRKLLETTRVTAAEVGLGLDRIFVVEDNALAAKNTGNSASPWLYAVSSPTDIAYVIMTSGSTGTPKGVTVTHDAARNTVVDINVRFILTQDDAILAISGLNFDLSVYDLFGPLAIGARVVVPDDLNHPKDPRHWIELIEQQQVTVWNSVPMLMQMLLERASTNVLLPSLRLCLMSGDLLPVDLPHLIKSACGERVVVVNLGGATEASIWNNFHEYTASSLSIFKTIPYGRPLANQRLHVLDSRFRHCPDYVTGDLYIAGRGLAEGYWDDPEKTRASFFDLPTTGERVYRTGDRGCYTTDGEILYQGRVDFQCKVKGFRIELGEIDFHLKAHPAVKNARAVPIDQRVVAFIVAEPPGDVPPKIALQQHLEEVLPDYMIPRDYFFVPSIPLTATNGKVDLKGLLALTTSNEAESSSIHNLETNSSPVSSSPVSAALRRAWQQVLNVPLVMAQDSFWELGGNSLLAIRMNTHLRNDLGIEVPLKVLFSQHSFTQIVQVLQEAINDLEPPAASPAPSPIEKTVSLSTAAPSAQSPLQCVTANPSGPGNDLFDLVSSKANDEPDIIAVKCGAKELSYGSLIAEADYFSMRLLRDTSEHPPRAVLIIAPELSIEVVVSMLAALRANIPYVIWDPTSDASARVPGHLRDACSSAIATTHPQSLAFAVKLELPVHFANIAINRRANFPLSSRSKSAERVSLLFHQQLKGFVQHPLGTLWATHQDSVVTFARMLTSFRGLEFGKERAPLQMNQHHDRVQLEIYASFAAGATLHLAESSISRGADQVGVCFLETVALDNLASVGAGLPIHKSAPPLAPGEGIPGMDMEEETVGKDEVDIDCSDTDASSLGTLLIASAVIEELQQCKIPKPERHQQLVVPVGDNKKKGKPRGLFLFGRRSFRR